jgi:hypothetical protein
MIGALVKRYWLQLLVVALIGVLAFFVNHYRDNAITYKDQRDKATRISAWLTPPSKTCRCASVMSLRWMPNTRRNCPMRKNH